MHLFAVRDVPLIQPGDDLAAIIAAGLERQGDGFQDGDILVVAQKILSKAEGRYVRLADVIPGPRTFEVAAATAKDPRLVELILQESQEILRMRKGVLITRHRRGYVMAQAGIDQSNIPSDTDDPQVLLLPEDPDGSAARLRAGIGRRTGITPHVIVSDSWGRPFRRGVVGFALGTAGFSPLLSRIGERDLYGRPLQVTEIAQADQLAAAASFLLGEAAEGNPAVIIRGAALAASDAGSDALLRALEDDLFR